jgi:hypothetical protein
VARPARNARKVRVKAPTDHMKMSSRSKRTETGRMSLNVDTSREPYRRADREATTTKKPSFNSSDK